MTIEIVRHYDFEFSYNSDTEMMSFAIVRETDSDDPVERLEVELDKVLCKFNILEYDADMYDKIALCMRRVACHLRTNYEDKEF